MVDLSYPPGEEAWKGSAVRRLKGYMSWVNTYSLYNIGIIFNINVLILINKIGIKFNINVLIIYLMFIFLSPLIFYIMCYILFYIIIYYNKENRRNCKEN